MYPDAEKLSKYNNEFPENKEAILVSSSQKLLIVEKFFIGKKPRGQREISDTKMRSDSPV